MMSILDGIGLKLQEVHDGLAACETEEEKIQWKRDYIARRMRDMRKWHYSRRANGRPTAYWVERRELEHMKNWWKIK